MKLFLKTEYVIIEIEYYSDGSNTMPEEWLMMQALTTA